MLEVLLEREALFHRDGADVDLERLKLAAADGREFLVMGDFNDSPKDSSIQWVMKHDFYNLAEIQENKNQGTNKYKLEWESIDQIMISNSMKAKMQEVSFKVVNLPFLLMKDEVNMGEKLFRTYVGPRYLGGFSDHLPVMATFVFKP